MVIIDGKTVRGNRKIEVRNPAAPDKVVGVCDAADAEQARMAVEAAWNAYPAWRKMDIKDRAGIIASAAAEIEKSARELAPLLTQEQGKVLSEAMMDCMMPAYLLRAAPAMADMLTKQETAVPDPQSGGWWQVKRNPIGVVSVITPWNWPVTLTWMPLMQALLMGNTVVVKPASYTPLAISKTIEVTAGLFPPGVVNLVPGSGSEVGDVLTTHPLVRKISFTGSTETGIDVMTKAARSIKKITLELGGNDAAIVLNDVDMSKETMQRFLWGIFSTSGQICMAIKRVYVHESIYSEFVDKLTELASDIVVGNGLDTRATMGPINNKPQLEKFKVFVDDARKRGAKVVQVGNKLDEKEFEKGYFYLPTIVTGVDQSYAIVKEEQFGPAIPIMPFKTENEAIRLANETTYGLASSVWSKNEKRAAEIAEQLEAGCTWINQHSAMAIEMQAPFGGQKQSGLGRSLGLEGLFGYSEAHTIVSKWMK